MAWETLKASTGFRMIRTANGSDGVAADESGGDIDWTGSGGVVFTHPPLPC